MRKTGPIVGAMAGALLLFAAGCGGDDETADGGGDTSPEELGELKVGIEAPWDLAYVPTSLTIAEMEEQGYNVEVVQFEEPDVMAQALESGDIHLGTNSAGQVLTAVDAGLDVRAVLGLTNPTFVMVATSDIATCEQLDGKRLGVQGQQDFILAASRTWIENECPGTEPEIVEIPGSENRMAALLQGQIDASGLHVLRSRQLAAENPGEFTEIEGFGAPEGVVSGWFYAKTDWLEENGELMATFADVYESVVTDIAAGPSIAVDEAQRLITDVDPGLLAEVTELWATTNAWPAKDAVSEEAFEATLAFYEDIEPYQSELTFDSVVWTP